MFGTVVSLLLLALPARAGELKLEFRDGRVTLLARDVSVQQILTEWSKLGGTQIVNLERVSVAPVTLQLEALSEQKALEIVLRSVAGYVAAPRRPEHPGPSAYDRILVLAVSNPPAAAPRPAGSPAAFPTPVFPGAPPPFPVPRELSAPAPTPLFPSPADDNAADVDEEVNTVARPPGAIAPGFPGGPAFPTMPAAPQRTPQPFSAAPGGTSVPGVVVPVPQPPNQPQTAQPPNSDR